MCYFFSVMDTYYSTPLMTVFSENSIQQKRLHTSVNNVVLLFSCGYSYHFSEQCGTFFSYGDRFLSSYNYCIQWNLNPTKISSHLSEQCGTFFQLWNPLQWSMWSFFSVMDTDNSNILITVCSETSIQQKCLPTSVNNMVLFFSYGYRYHFSE